MRYVICLTVLLVCNHVFGQLDLGEGNSKLSPKELTIPTSPLFDLMGVAPSQVARTADIKDFKVDWSFSSWRLNPNIALQAQPVWEMFYNRKKLDKYRRASKFDRMLASLDVSLGTIQTANSDRRIGGAAKMSLLRQNDPLLKQGVYDDIEQSFNAELERLKQKEKEILQALDTLTRFDLVIEKKKELQENDALLSSFYSRRNIAVQERAAAFAKENWNSSYIDIAFGKIYTYGTDSSGSLKKLKLNRSSGSGLWVNFGFGMGKRGLISGLVRSSFYSEEVSFLLENSTGNIETLTAVANNNLFTLGINYRYGGPVYNFFAEFIYEGKTVTTASKALSKAFKAEAGTTIIEGSAKWDSVLPYSINIGGDWRISRNVILNYGIRCVMDKHFKNTAVTPIASISCMMR